MTKKKEFIWEHDGIEYTITKSDKEHKKLQAEFVNPKTGNVNTIHFGQDGASHYFDKTGLLPKKLNHLDKKRRELYRARHKNDKLNEPSAGLLSWHLLW